MDALVHNKCEREVLELTKAIAKVCGVSINMETEPMGKGGAKSWLTITPKTPKRTPAGKLALVNLLVTASLSTTTSIGEALPSLIEKLNVDKGEDKTAREQAKQGLKALKAEASTIVSKLDQHAVVKKRRSTFYDMLRKYAKVNGFSVGLTDESKKLVVEEQLVERDRFKSFLLSSASVAPQVVDQAEIEIISPVLVKGRHKWKGMYEGAPISFVMKSDAFMTMVQTGKVEFKSGSTISCALEIEKKLSGTGTERITGYNILHVSSYSENGKTIVTTEEKLKQKQQTVSKRQLDLFG